jgi:DNA-binding transcriptional MerR regulator
MYSIGQFSKLIGVTAKALYLYERWVCRRENG